MDDPFEGSRTLRDGGCADFFRSLPQVFGDPYKPLDGLRHVVFEPNDPTLVSGFRFDEPVHTPVESVKASCKILALKFVAETHGSRVERPHPFFEPGEVFPEKMLRIQQPSKEESCGKSGDGVPDAHGHRDSGLYTEYGGVLPLMDFTVILTMNKPEMQHPRHIARALERLAQELDEKFGMQIEQLPAQGAIRDVTGVIVGAWELR